jgi:glycerophosphoryl diester phosphodiesterase
MKTMKKFFTIVFLLVLIVPAMAADKIVIAHRGASGYLPEHTLPAYAMAYAMGVDYVEPDVVLTKDDVFICVHDIYIDDTTDVKEIFPDRQRKDGHWYAVDFTLAEIKQLHVHERTNKDGTSVFPGRFPQNMSNFEVPTFAEMIELIQGLNKSTGRNVGICPEFKSPSFHKKEGHQGEEKLLEILTEYGYQDKNIYLQCFDPDCLKKIRFELKSNLPLLQLIGEPEWEYTNEVAYINELNKENLSEIATYADVLSPEKSRIEKNPEIITLAHESGMKVIPYTFRADSLPEQYKTFEEELNQFYMVYGVDGIFTDFADRGVNFVKSLDK